MFAKATPVDYTTSVLSASSYQTKHHFLIFSSHLRLGLLDGQTFERTDKHFLRNFLFLHIDTFPFCAIPLDSPSAVNLRKIFL